MTNLTGTNYRFYAGNIYHGSTGIYKAVHDLLNRENQIFIDQIHQQTVGYYFQHKKENEYGWGEDARRQTLAILHDVMICVLTHGENETPIQVSYYGENPSSGKKFIYMFYDETTLYYYPLYANDEANPLNKLTTFIHNNTVENLLGVFVRDRFHYTGEIDFGNILAKYVSTSMEVDLATIFDSTLINGSQKRKRPGVADISLSSNGNQILSPTNSINDDDDDHDLNKRTKLVHSPSDHIPQSNTKHARTKAIGSLIRTDGESDVDSPVNEEEIENSSASLNDANHEEKNYLDILTQSNREIDSFLSKSTQSNEEPETRYFVFE